MQRNYGSGRVEESNCIFFMINKQGSSSMLKGHFYGLSKSPLNGLFKSSSSVLILYTMSSSILILLNRRILFNSDDPTPLTLTLTQQFLVTIIYTMFTTLKHGKSPFRLRELKLALPVSLTFISSILLNIVSIKYTSVAGYTISRASTLFFSLILSKLFLSQTHNWLEFSGCTIISLSTFITTPWNHKLNEDFAGIIFGILSSFIHSVFVIFVLKVLKTKKISPVRLLGHYTIESTVCLFILCKIFNPSIQAINTQFLSIISGNFGQLLKILVDQDVYVLSWVFRPSGLWIIVPMQSRSMSAITPNLYFKQF